MATASASVLDLPYIPYFDDRAEGQSSPSSIQAGVAEIIEHVRELIGAEKVGFWIHDSESDVLVLQMPAPGFGERVAHLSLNSPCRVVRAYLSSDCDVLNENLDDLVRRNEGDKAPLLRNGVILPVVVAGKARGVVCVANKLGRFTKNDLKLARVLSFQLGMSLHNTQLLENERRTVTSLQQMNLLVDQQRDGLQRTLEIHDQLTKMVLDGQGIEAICARLSRLFANHVVVKDRYARLITTFPNDDDPSVDEGWRQMLREGGTPPGAARDPAVGELLVEVNRRRRPVVFPPMPHLGWHLPRVVAPIVVGEETLAYVTVLQNRRLLDELDVMALERAAVAMALHMMKEKASAEAHYKLVGDLVGELVAGDYGSDEPMRRRASYLGVDLLVPRAVLVADVDDLSRFATAEPIEEDIIALKVDLFDVVTRACRELAPGALLSTRSDEVIILAKVCEENTGLPVDLTRLGDGIRMAVRERLPGISVSVGIGGRSDNLAEYGRSYHEARRALDVVKTLRRADRTLAFDQLGISSVLFDPNVLDRITPLAQGLLGRLVEYDRRHNADLVETLDQYLRHGCHFEPTAATMHVHLSTIRYRIRRIEQITQTDLDDAEERFNFQLALKVARMLRST